MPKPARRPEMDTFIQQIINGLVLGCMYALVALHVLAALKHQFIDRDNVLHRMIPWIPRRDQVG